MNIGSKIAVQRLTVEMPAKQIATDETRAEAKNKIQWAEIINPTATIFMIVLRPIRNGVFRKYKIRNKAEAAIRVRKKTNSTAGIEINLPKMAVKPQRKTIK